MTASHVLRGACRPKVETSDGKWISVDRWTTWYSRHSSAEIVDVATLRLHASVDGFLFRIRTSSAAVGANVAMLGHPFPFVAGRADPRAADARSGGWQRLAYR